MKNYFIVFLFLGFINSGLKAQQEVIDSNIVLLNKLETRYKTPCVKFERKKVKKKTERIDKKVIEDLNEIYSSQMKLGRLIELLNSLGYKESTKIQSQERNIDTIYFRKITKGQLDGYVKLIYDIKGDKLYDKKIVIATKSHFYCETKEWQSYSYVDFIYLRKFVNKIRIPLRIAGSNVELESK